LDTSAEYAADAPKKIVRTNTSFNIRKLMPVC
jgi:hypothetical protein